jgi:hypothetical protein
MLLTHFVGDACLRKPLVQQTVRSAETGGRTLRWPAKMNAADRSAGRAAHPQQPIAGRDRGADRGREQHRHSVRSFQRTKGNERSFTSPGAPAEKKRNQSFFGTRDSLTIYYAKAVCCGCGQQEENTWIRKLPGFSALRLR